MPHKVGEIHDLRIIDILGKDVFMCIWLDYKKDVPEIGSIRNDDDNNNKTEWNW